MISCFTLDIRQFENNNCHQRTLEVAICSIPILQGVRLSFKPTTDVADTFKKDFKAAALE